MLETRDPRVVVCPEVPRWPETEALLRAGLSKQAAATLHAFHERFCTNKRCHLIYLRAQAALSQSQGDYERAQVSLQEAIVEAKALGLPGELWQAEAALGQLHLACGEPEQAGQAFARASVILEKLARAITSEELHFHFLGSPQVQQILLQRKSELFNFSLSGSCALAMALCLAVKPWMTPAFPTIHAFIITSVVL